MLKSENGGVLVKGTASEVCADLAIAILSVRDCLVEYGLDIGDANAHMAQICSTALATEYGRGERKETE